MKYLTPIPKQFVNQSGIPYSNGTVSVYLSGNDELADIFEDAEGDALCPNPCTLDSNGAWQCFVTADVPLDYIVKDAEGNVVASYFGVVVSGGGTGDVTKAYVDTQDRALGTRISNLDQDLADEADRAEAAEKAAKTEVVEGENIRVEETIAPDGHSIFKVSSDGAPQEQADWNQQDPSEPDYIKNKPTKLSKFTDDITKQALVESGVGIEKPVSSAAVNAGLSEKADKVQGATAGNLAALDANGNLTDSGNNAADFATDEQGTKADTAVQGVKVNGTELSKDGNNVVDVPVPTASTDTPLKDGTASAGSSTQWARGDHRHPTDDSREAVSNKAQSINDASTTEYPSSKAVADFVNSSVATNTATFLGNFSLADLSLTYPATEVQIAAALNSHTWPTGYPTNNDYVYVEIRNPQSTIDDKVQRYKYRDRLASWGYEYTLNNSSFTAEEKASIDSGITSQDVTNLRADHTTLGTHVADTSNPHGVTKTQVGLGNVDNTSDADKPISTAQQTALNAKQNTISDLATIRSGAASGATAVQPSTMNSALAGKQDVISDLSTIRSGASAGATALQPSGDGSNVTAAFTAASTRENIFTGEKFSVIFGKIAKWFADLKSVAWSGSYADLSNKPTIPTVDQTYSATSTNAQSGTAVAQAVSDKQNNHLAVYSTTNKIVKLFRLYKFTDLSHIGTTVELIGRAGGTAVRMVINIKGSITADYIQFYDFNGDTSHNFTLYVAQDPDDSSKNLVYASMTSSSALYVNAADASAGDTDVDLSVFGEVMSERISGDTPITLRNLQDASWIKSGTFGSDRIADDAITAAKVKDNETLPVNVSGSAGSAKRISGISLSGKHWYKVANLSTTSQWVGRSSVLVINSSGYQFNEALQTIVSVSRQRKGGSIVNTFSVCCSESFNSDMMLGVINGDTLEIWVKNYWTDNRTLTVSELVGTDGNEANLTDGSTYMSYSDFETYIADKETVNPSLDTGARWSIARKAGRLIQSMSNTDFNSFNGTVETTNVVNSKAGSASTNPPKSDSRTFHVITTVGSNTNYQTQLAIGIDSNRHAGLFYRCREGGTWNAWMQVLNERPNSIAKGNANVGIYIDSNGHPVACSYGLSIGTAVANSSILTVL